MFKTVFDLGRATYESWSDARTIRLGAGLAYYGLFAIVPILALTAVVVSVVFDQADAASFLADKMGSLGGLDGEEVADVITRELDRRSVGTSLGLIGLGSLIFAASLFFLALSDAVNVIWQQPVAHGFRNTIRRRLTSFLMVLVVSGALIADLAVSAVAGLAAAILPGNAAIVEDLAQVTTTVASGVALVGAMALLFRFLASNPVLWRDATVAAIAAGVMMVLGTKVTAWYLQNFGGSSLSGAFGAVLVALTWIYYQAQILLVGVHLSRTLTTWRAVSRPNDGDRDR